MKAVPLYPRILFQQRNYYSTISNGGVLAFIVASVLTLMILAFNRLAYSSNYFGATVWRANTLSKVSGPADMFNRTIEKDPKNLTSDSRFEMTGPKLLFDQQRKSRGQLENGLLKNKVEMVRFHNGNVYLFVPQMLRNEKSEQYCKSKGMSLAWINSKDENEFIRRRGAEAKTIHLHKIIKANPALPQWWLDLNERGFSRWRIESGEGKTSCTVIDTKDGSWHMTHCKLLTLPFICRANLSD